MNRKIMFRGKRKDNGKWAYGYYAVYRSIWGFTQHIIYSHNAYGGNDAYEVDGDTVGQYTGLTNKDGKKIFEGDVVKATWLHLNINDTVVGKIVFYNTSFVLETKDYFLFLCENIMEEDCTVIGNIYDSPEMLYEEE